MYCINCGAKLADRSEKCPLCGTHLPEWGEKASIPLYPKVPRPRDQKENLGILFLLTLIFLLLGTLALMLDLITFGTVSFSFYVITPLFLFYAAFLLPRWWNRPNPVIFFPIVYLCVLVFLFFLNLRLGGAWFWTFILPLSGGCFLFLEAAVVLLRYLKKGKLYIFGGLFTAFGALSFVGEILYRATYALPIALTYSLLPLVLFALPGLGLIVIAIVPPLRRSFEKRFFV